MSAAREFRVVWRRKGISRAKSKRFATEKAARRHMVLLGPEPWVALGKDPEALWCCPGTLQYECGCGGQTVRQADEAYRAEAPPVLWVRIESRPVGKWKVRP